MKTCSKCGESKPLEDYEKRTKSKDGRRGQCKECARPRKRALERERYQERASYITEWHEKNRDRRKECARIVYANNPGKSRNKINTRRSLRSNNGIKTVSAQEIAQIIAMPCTACNECGPSEVDHIVPLSRGGAHRIGNLMPLCRKCNCSKSNMLYIEWKYSARPQALKAFAA